MVGGVPVGWLTSLLPLAEATGTALMASTVSVPAMTLPNTAYPLPGSVVPDASRAGLSTTLMKNWLVALSGALVRARATV